MSLLRYSSVVCCATAAVAGLAWALDLRWRDGATLTAVSFGLLLAVANTIAAYALARWADGRSAKAFMTALLGGMLARMVVVLAAVVLGVAILDLPRVPLVLGLLPAFMLFLVFELSVAHRQAGSPAVVR